MGHLLLHVASWWAIVALWDSGAIRPILEPYGEYAKLEPRNKQQRGQV
jgi:hypothetical protein